MVDDYTLEIQKKLEALPPDVRKLVYSAEMESVLRQIGVKNQLHVDKIGLLESETVAVMIGITNPNDFVSNLADTLNIDEIKSKAVANDVNTMLLLKIRESMKNAPRAATAPVPVKITTPAAPPPTPPAPPKAPQSIPKAIELHPADMMLAQKTVSIAPAAPVLPIAPKPAAPTPPPTSPIPPATPPVAPKPYTADPYREVPE